MIDKLNVHDDEMLYRSISEEIFATCLNGVSSAVYKSKNGGVSVDREGCRSVSEIFASFLLIRPKTKAMTQIKTLDCRNLDTIVIPLPLNENIYHAEIHNSSDKIEMSDSKAKKLSRKSKLIETPL